MRQWKIKKGQIIGRKQGNNGATGNLIKHPHLPQKGSYSARTEKEEVTDRMERRGAAAEH